MCVCVFLHCPLLYKPYTALHQHVGGVHFTTIPSLVFEELMTKCFMYGWDQDLNIIYCSGVLCTDCLPQIQKVVIALGDYLDVQCHACIGGTNVRDDQRKLEMGQQIVVGTPGRVFDMISRRSLGNLILFLDSFYDCVAKFLDPRSIKLFVLDEADEMLSRGFKDQIYDVFRKLPSSIQVPYILKACVPYISHTGSIVVGHHACRCSGGNQEIHA